MTALVPYFTAGATLQLGAGGNLAFAEQPTTQVTALLSPFFRGDPGPIGPPGPEGPPGGITLEQARDVAADQDTVLIYDFDSIVTANLGV